MSGLLYIFNSNKKSINFKKILPKLSITESINKSKIIARSRVNSFNPEPRGFITSRIELI